jgi:hypothetical protein
MALLATLHADEELATKAAVAGDPSGLVALARSGGEDELRLALMGVNVSVLGMRRFHAGLDSPMAPLVRAVPAAQPFRHRAQGRRVTGGGRLGVVMVARRALSGTAPVG